MHRLASRALSLGAATLLGCAPRCAPPQATADGGPAAALAAGASPVAPAAPDLDAGAPTSTAAPSEAPAPPAPAASMLATAPAGPATAAAPPPIVAAEAVLPQGPLPLARDGATAVPPPAGFRVEVGTRLAGCRLSLLDAQDAMVAADGTTDIGETTRFTLTPAAPLRPGSSYWLRLEGAEGRLLHGADGRTYQPLSLQIQTEGDPPPPPRRRGRSRRR